MTTERIIAFLMFAFVSAVTPGPSNVMIIATTTAHGVVRGALCAFGAAAGISMLLAAAALGLGQVLALAPWLALAAKLGGAAFLLWLAWKIASADPTAPAGSGSMSGAPIGAGAAALFQLINPKGWLVAISGAGAFMPADGGIGTAALIGALFFAAALPGAMTWVGLGRLVRATLSSPRAARAFNLAMALALVASVAMIFI